MNGLGWAPIARRSISDAPKSSAARCALARHRGGACERFHSHHQSGPVVDDQAGIQRFDQRRLGRSMIAEHQGTHAGTGEVHAEHEDLVALAGTRSGGEPDVPHPDEVGVDEGDEGLRLGCRDERHVVPEASRERGGVCGRRASCRQVAGEYLQGRLVREDPHEYGVVLQPACDRGRFRDGLQSRRMVTLDDREGDLHVQRTASDGLVATAPGEEGIDPVDALAHSAVSPVLPEPGRHRQTEVRPVWVGQAVPQCGADVVGFEIQLVERCELRCHIRSWPDRTR